MSPLRSEGEDTNDANYARWYWLVPRTDIDDYKFMLLPYQEKMSIPTCRVLPGFLLCREKWNADYYRLSNDARRCGSCLQ